MRPSRRVAILFVTTLLSTRHLLAQSVEVQYRPLPSTPMFGVEGTATGQERAGVVSSKQSRSYTTQDDEDCVDKTPVQIGPGNPAGTLLIENPVQFRWTGVTGADHYHLFYSVDGKPDVDVKTKQTQATVTLAAGSNVAWRVRAHKFDDNSGEGSCDKATSGTLRFRIVQPCTTPSITEQPASPTIDEGSSATLTVSANGTGPLTYQWYRGTTKVGTNSNTFTTGPLTQTTTYRVVVTNACGTVTSNDATVTVTAACQAPAIAQHPAGTSITRGNSTTLTVAANGTAPLTYEWYRGATQVGTNSNSLATGPLTATSTFRVIVTNACGTATSNEATVTVSEVAPVCRALKGAPRLSAVIAAASNAPYALKWTKVENATQYEVEESTSTSFDHATKAVTEDLTAGFRHKVTEPSSFYYRVRGVNGCDQSTSPWSPVVRVAVALPQESTSRDLIVPHGTREKVLSTITVDVNPDATSFTAAATEPWITVTPSSGGVPPNGRLQLTLSADPRSLPNGTSMASLRIETTGSSARGVATNASTKLLVPVSISLVTPVVPAMPANGGEVLILPAVAHSHGVNSQWQSDVRIAHTYANAVRYLLTFTPSGAGIESAMQTEISVDAAQTIALDDILGRWFGAGQATDGSTGVLEIRTLDANAGAGRTLATSRLFNIAENGSFGQFIAAVPLAKFLNSSANGSHTLVALSQSDRFRTNIGLVAGGGKPADILLEIFSASGAKLYDTTLHLNAGEHRQIGQLLSSNGIDAKNARINVSLASPAGSVFSYGSVIDNETGDPSFVPPVEAMASQARRYTIAGVANLQSGAGGKWQTDVRLFNGGFGSAAATVEFFEQGQSQPSATRTVDVEAGQMLVLDDVVQSLFGMSGAGGALRITTPTDTALVPAARTYHKRDNGTYGQFIQGATDDNTTHLGGEPLHILQVEESTRFRTNVGLAETTGEGATVELMAALPNSKIAAVTEVTLAPNEYRQMNALLRSMGLDESYNATVTVRVTGGNGRVMAYGSVIDNRTQDPTYVMGY
jgi:Ig-like domain CHU_C associated/Viral BACON domain